MVVFLFAPPPVVVFSSVDGLPLLTRWLDRDL